MPTARVPKPDREREIVTAATAILEAEGSDGLTTRRLAERVGMRAPSLYKHFPDKQAIENAVIDRGFWALGEHLAAVAAESADPLGGIVGAYRAYAIGHPHLYRLIFGSRLDRDRLDPEAERFAGAALRAICHDDDALSVTVWSFAHGIAMLELDGRFPPTADVDVVWDSALGAMREMVEGSEA